jgi:transglutaminase-like putative cysteine protease
LPAFVLCASWLRLESPRRTGEAFAIVVLALAPVVAPTRRRRRAAVVATFAAGAWIAFGAQPWELAPFRDERVLDPIRSDIGRGITDFYGVLLPLEPDRNPEMHSLVLCAIFGFTLAIGLLVVARRPMGAAAVTVAGAGWPATLIGDQAVGIGALALVGALSIPLVLRVRSRASLLLGATIGAIIVGGAAWASSATTIARDAALNWEAWDIRGAPAQAASVRFAWESTYGEIAFPAKKTVVLTVGGPDRARYWRASTLDLFTTDRWYENLLWLDRVDGRSDQIRTDTLTPPQAARRDQRIEQRIEIRALVDDHLVAAGTPVALDAPRLRTIFVLSGGVLRTRDPVREGLSYRVWSYAPDPSPAALAASRALYPAAADRYLEIDSRRFPAFGAPRRESRVDAMFSDPEYARFVRHAPMYAAARRIAGRARSPYGVVLALESWFRQRGGFRYDESPPRVAGPPALVTFVTRTKAGYCQHFAGAMAAILRMLDPARVAVGLQVVQRRQVGRDGPTPTPGSRHGSPNSGSRSHTDAAHSRPITLASARGGGATLRRAS